MPENAAARHKPRRLAAIRVSLDRRFEAASQLALFETKRLYESGVALTTCYQLLY